MLISHAETFGYSCVSDVQTARIIKYRPISRDTGRERLGGGGGGGGGSPLPIDFDFSVRKSADGRVHCEGWRVPRVYRTRHAIPLSPCRCPVRGGRRGATKCAAVAFPRACAYAAALRIRTSAPTCRRRQVRSSRRCSRATPRITAPRTCTLFPIDARLRRRREATYVIPVARFSNGGITVGSGSSRERLHVDDE